MKAFLKLFLTAHAALVFPLGLFTVTIWLSTYTSCARLQRSVEIDQKSGGNLVGNTFFIYR